jgi:hypothetical protein
VAARRAAAPRARGLPAAEGAFCAAAAATATATHALQAAQATT